MDHPGWGRDKRAEHPEAYSLMQGAPEFGCDVARFGNDRTVIYEGHGSYVSPAVIIHQQDEFVVANRLLQLIDFDNWNTKVRIDDGGVGGGVTTALKHYKANHRKNFKVIPVNFGSASLESKRMKQNPIVSVQARQVGIEDRKPKFANRRAEMYWNTRELINAKKVWLPDDEDLANELASIRYTYNKNEQIIIEDKSEYKKRTGKSPDKADALVLLLAGRSTNHSDKLRTAAAKPRIPQPTITGELTKTHQPAAQQRHTRANTIMGGASRRY